MLKYSHPTLAWILDLWPVTIFAPAILLLIATLALITRWWDQQDQAAREATQTPAPASEANVVVSWESGSRRKPSATGVAGPEQTAVGDHDARAAS
jgi:hypothetical protein